MQRAYLNYSLVAILTVWSLPTSAGSVGLLCYPIDEFIRKSCEVFEKQMKVCGVKVARVDDFSGDLENQFEKTRMENIISLPPSAPIFIVGHGNSLGKKHYIDSAHGDIQKIEAGPQDKPKVAPNITVELERTLPTERVFSTESILRALGERPIILSSCFSGRACEISGLQRNFIASCSEKEVSIPLQIEKGLTVEPILFWLAKLYCDEKLFEAADTDPAKGELSEAEISSFLGKKLGGQKAVPFVFVPRTLNVNEIENKLVSGWSRSPEPESEVRTANSDRVGEAAKRASIDLTSGKPNLKGHVLDAGTMYTVHFKGGVLREPVLLPGYYTNSSDAEQAVNELTKANHLPHESEFKLHSEGRVYEVVIENMSRPCIVGPLGLTQSPQIRGTVRPIKNHD